MRRLLLVLLLAVSSIAVAQNKKPPTDLRGVLLEQLRTTHDEADWFVPAKTAVEGLSAEQAKWSPGKGNHSVGQLAYHIWFWDARALADFKGEKLAHYFLKRARMGRVVPGVTISTDLVVPADQ